MNKRINILKSQPVILTAVIALLIAIISIMNPRFLTQDNFIIIGQQIAVLGIATMAATMLLKSGLFDLSSAGNISLTCVLVSLLIMEYNVTPWVAGVIGLMGSFLMGGINGIIVSKTKTPPLIITLGMSWVYSGMALVLTGGVFISLRGQFSFLGRGRIMDIPVSILIFIGISIITYFILRSTRYGRRLTAIGNNSEVAYLSGINVDRYIIANYTLSGGLVGLAALVLLSRLGSVVATVGVGYELRAIAAAIIGGISIAGGKGSVLGAFLGVILLGVLSNGMNMVGIHSLYQDIVLGLIVVSAVIMSNFDKIRRA